MAITTLDEVVSGMMPVVGYSYFSNGSSGTNIGHYNSSWGRTGINPVGTWDATLNGVTLTSANGGIYFANAAGGDTAYLARMNSTMGRQSAAMAHGVHLLCDRLWHNGGITITSTSAQNITSPTWPARDINGATAGDGVLIGVEVEVTTGAGTPTFTMSYTNSDGTSGRSANGVIAGTATSVGGTFYLMGLQAGDTGVQSVQSFTLSATWTSGTIHLVAFRPILCTGNPGLGPSYVDPISGCLPKIHNGSTLFWVCQAQSTALGQHVGELQYTYG